ncbi:MAG: SDH family Clp fold serine proteinase [Candidatus Bipolaricaulaceae bacterium]
MIGDIVSLLFFLLLLQALVPFMQRRMLEFRRKAAIRALELKRKSRVITMIHRQESVSFLGFTLARYIDIEDSEQVLRAIRMTPPDMPIDLVLHTPGGLVLAAEQIACALKRHKGKVTVFIPHYAMSGGTLIALAADEIVMDPNAVLGPVDPQLATGQGYIPAASVLKALEQPNPNREDQTLILGDIARKAIQQVYETVYALLRDKLPEERAQEVARLLSEGRWTHDYPITVEELRAMGLPVSEEMPREVYELMELYPQAPQRRPGVEFIPVPYAPGQPSRGGESK